MPIRDLMVEMASTAIFDPVSTQVTYSVLSRLGLKGQFNDTNVYIETDYRKPSLTSNENHEALIAQDRCDVKAVVNLNPTELKWDIQSFKYTQAYGTFAGLDKTLVPAFYDSVANVRVTEHQVPCVMTFEFALQFRNRESAYMTISAINNTSLRDSVIVVHDIVYNYPISTDMVTSLYQIYLLRKPFLGNLDFENYMKQHTRGAAQVIQQRTGELKQLVIKKIDIRAIGVLEYTQSAPQIETQDGSVNRFGVDFTYTIQFARPDVLRLYFPVVICNQMVPPWLLRPAEKSNLAFLSGVLQEKSITGYLRYITPHTPVVARLPEYDDFRPPRIPVGAAGFREFFDAVVLLDETTPTKIDLLDIGPGLRINPTAVAIMKLHGAEIFATTGLYNISVYRNDIPVDISCLSIDENLVVSIEMSDKTKRYHLVISEATNLNFLDRRWLDVVIEYRTFFPITIIRNFQRLIDLKYCYIDRTNQLILLVNDLIQKLQIDQQIATLIAAGHLTHYAYSFATTAEQFVAYIIHHISPVDKRPVYDAYVTLCLSTGLLTQNMLSTGYVRTKDGYPFLPRNARGLTSSINTPLRVENVNVSVSPSRS